MDQEEKKILQGELNFSKHLRWIESTVVVGFIKSGHYNILENDF